MANRKNPDRMKQGVVAMKTRGAGKPLLRAKTALRAGSPKKRCLDILKGRVTVPPAFFEPLSEEELQLWDS